MRTILLCGGSGKRLWPLSNEIRSKIFLSLLPAEDGGTESMIQRVCRQLERVGLLSSALIVTHHSQAEITRHHVGSRIPILAEPERRGTFPAVALAARYLHARGLAGPDDAVAVIPVDAYVEPEFYRLLSRMPDILVESGAELALIGSVPAHPSTEYGYIVPEAAAAAASCSGNRNGYLPVSQFIEKPDKRTAARLIREKALWNCGVFVFRLSYMLSCLADKGLPADFDKLLGQYASLPAASFDNEIAEQTRRRIVMPYDKTWRDLGDWSVLPDYLGHSVIGEGQISGDSLHTHLINDLTYPIRVIGASNLIVAAGPDGILVADKTKAHLIKQMVPDLQYPMCGEKRWGLYRVLDYSKTGSGLETLTKKVTLLAGSRTSVHLHRRRQEVLTILTGSGEFMLEGACRSVQPGDVLRVPQGARHSLKAFEPLAYIAAQIGTGLMEEDTVRGFEDTCGDQ